MAVYVVGTPELIENLRKLGKRADWALGRALYREGERIMAVSKRDYVPVDTGILKGSGHVQLPKPGPVVYLGYGGPASAYALVQHEAHYKHSIGQRKYLERPMLLAIPDMGKRLGKDINDALIKPAAKTRRRG